MHLLEDLPEPRARQEGFQADFGRPLLSRTLVCTGRRGLVWHQSTAGCLPTRHPPHGVRWPGGSACRHEGSPGTTCATASGAPSRSNRLSSLPRRPLQPLVPWRLQVMQVLRPRVFRPRPCPAAGQPARRPPQRALRWRPSRYSLSD